VGFSKEVKDANGVLLDSSQDDETRITCLNEWIQKHQPCLFGTMAAGPSDLISYCFLYDDDLSLPDEEIKTKIQAARKGWKLDAFEGLKSALVLVAISPNIITASPGKDLMALALRLCSLYLDDQLPVQPDERRQDEILLRLLGTLNAQWFAVGVDFFSVQGDRRWWHDHRFPGGIAFVMNSPGHMALAEAQRRALEESANEALLEEYLRLKRAPNKEKNKQLEKAFKAALARLKKTKVESLSSVLKFAMYTILGASEQTNPALGPTWESPLCQYE